MPHPTFQKRFLWRFKTPLDAGEIRRTERWLASARVFLAISLLVTIWMDPSEIRHSVWAYGLLFFYILHGLVIMFLLRLRQESTTNFRFLVHMADILWPALISAFTGGVGNPFFLFFVFVMAAAAYRWGLWETAGTAASAVLLLWMESLAFHLGLVTWLDRILAVRHLAHLNVAIDDFTPRHLFMRSVYLLVMGLMVGYLAEQQKRLRSEKDAITRILSRVRVEAGLTGTLQEFLRDLMSIYNVEQALVVSQETKSHHAFVGEAKFEDSGSLSFCWLDSKPTDREAYLFEAGAEASYIWREGGEQEEAFGRIALDQRGSRIRNLSLENWHWFTQRHKFDRVVMASFIFGQEWWGRIFLFNPAVKGDIEDELRFLQELVRMVGPAIYNVYLLRRLRQRAGAVERARFVRELHDGAVQSLIAVEMQVDVLRRQSVKRLELVPEELGRIQGLLREEILKLREMMQQMKSLDVDSRKFVRFLADTVERFQRETGISAHFQTDVHYLEMPQQVCRELAAIVQEGLVNVRKHSRAKQVLVRFDADNGAWNIVIEDNGCGFSFTGRSSLNELDGQGKGPVVIKERVRLLNGELTIESNPGRGACLEIKIPQKQETDNG